MCSPPRNYRRRKRRSWLASDPSTAESAPPRIILLRPIGEHLEDHGERILPVNGTYRSSFRLRFYPFRRRNGSARQPYPPANGPHRCSPATAGPTPTAEHGTRHRSTLPVGTGSVSIRSTLCAAGRTLRSPKKPARDLACRVQAAPVVTAALWEREYVPTVTLKDQLVVLSIL